MGARTGTLCPSHPPTLTVLEAHPTALQPGKWTDPTALTLLSLSEQVRELSDSEFPHSFLVSGKQRTLELQAR